MTLSEGHTSRDYSVGDDRKSGGELGNGVWRENLWKEEDIISDGQWMQSGSNGAVCGSIRPI